MRSLALLLLSFVLAACGGGNAPTPAKPHAGSSATASVGGATLQASTVALADLNATVAARYGLAAGDDGLLLLVTVRDAAGNSLSPADLQLSATTSVLPDPPKPLSLRAIQTAGMTDYIGVVQANAPASVQFQLVAKRGTERSEVTTTVDLQH